MLKKYFPFIILIAAILFYWCIKKNQRSNYKTKNIAIEQPVIDIQEFNRYATKIQYSKHAKCRMLCRYINETEVKEILEKGEINYDKIETGAKGKTYPLEGITHDNQHVRIVVAPKNKDSLVIVTCIDLDKEWPCDCE
ncbi:MAG: DUF4258 domain-containing protein [Chitinophagaceae bacterium]|nr:DUF4258 domain-containing protein [Chitinophagaceae bacterium]